VRGRIVELAAPREGDTVVDVGAGTGLLALAFAERVARVWAIDSSPAMCDYLRVKAASGGFGNIETVSASAVSLPLVDGVADLVVSNYCLHELRHADKDLALAEALRVLKPGGRLVLGDMMFSLNPAHSRDRRVVGEKLREIASRGLPGVWRLLKNAARLATGQWEHPADAQWWEEALKRAGFRNVAVEMLAHEGGIASAERPSRRTGAEPSPGRTDAEPHPARTDAGQHPERTDAEQHPGRTDPGQHPDVQGSDSSEAVPGTLPSADSRARAAVSSLR
jgi:ubiquinone/menaquinone biosynthesis C-methylase UbiE